MNPDLVPALSIIGAFAFGWSLGFLAGVARRSLS